MVRALVIQVDLVEARSVVEIAKANQADFLESGEATVNLNQVAGGVGKVTVDLLDARGR